MRESDLLYLGAGARDGDRLTSLCRAARELPTHGVFVHRMSSLYETEPVGLPGERPLYNAVFACSSALSPAAVLRSCLDIERDLGRRRAAAGAGPDPGPRPIDLDLLLWGERVLTDDRLELPHPRLHQRRFVLVPLAEIAPGTQHPILGETIGVLLDRCTDTAWVHRLDVAWPADLTVPTRPGAA